MNARPGHVRYKVVAFAVAMAAITYLDRVSISTLAPAIMRDLRLTRVEMSYIFAAFPISYALFEIPTAWWGERIGTRRVLARIVGWWSAFTAATGAVTSYPVMLVVRFLFGAGEAGAWPNAAKAFSRWIPAVEMGRVQGVFFMSAHLTGGLAPGIVLLLETYIGWRAVFPVLGAIGLVWTLAWYRWYRDDPSEHAQVGAAELELIVAGRRDRGDRHDAGTWRALAKNPSAWWLCLGYASNAYGSYFMITWLPAYLAERRGFEKGALAFFAGLPLMLSVLADLSGGWTTDTLSRRFGLRVGRCSVGVGSYFVAALCTVLAANAVEARAAAVMIAVATAASMLALAASWAAAIDIGGSHAGVLSAAMNTTGQIAAIASPLVPGYLVQKSANWALPLYVMAGLYFFSSICWALVHPETTASELREPVTVE
jgi:MFS transporter, ACS family, glucarate transporter